MQLLTAKALETQSAKGLSILFHDIAKRLPRVVPGTIEHAAAIGSLQNISQAMACRPR